MSGTSNPKISHCDILDNIVFGDHIPLQIVYSFSYNASINVCPTHADERRNEPYVNWSSATDDDRLKYNELTDSLLSGVHLNREAAACSDMHCCNANHLSNIDVMYMHIVNCLHDSSLSTFGDKVRKSQRIVPGWNEHVSELHAHAKCCYVIWRNCGKPRQGTEHADMKISRARFKLIFRECLRNEETMKADAIAAKLKVKRKGTPLWVHTA